MGETGRGLDVERFIESLELLRRAYLLYALFWLQYSLILLFIFGAFSLGKTMGSIVLAVYGVILIGFIVAFLYYFRSGIRLFSSVAGVDPRLRGLRKYGNLMLVGVASLVAFFLALVLTYATNSGVAALLMIVLLVVGIVFVEVSVFLPIFRIGMSLGDSRVVVGAFLSLVPGLAIIGGFLVFSGLGRVMKSMSASS